MEQTTPGTVAVTGAARDYDMDIVKMFFTASVVWGLVGMLVGVIIAAQLAWWPANLGLPWTSFGRLRLLHTNAVIFAFAGNVVFTGIYHSMQRLLKTRMFSDGLSRIHFWGWQLIIVLAAVTLPLGMTQSKEYAELIWPIAVLQFGGHGMPAGRGSVWRDRGVRQVDRIVVQPDLPAEFQRLLGTDNHTDLLVGSRASEPSESALTTVS